LILYPFLRCRITDPVLIEKGECLYDIQGALGYNGIASSTRDSALLAEFHSQFSAYCRDTNIVAEMTRLNPALGNLDLCGETMTLTVSNRNVIVDLTIGEEEMWRHHYSHAARKQVNKGQRNGLVTRLAISDEDIIAFYTVFQSTMERNHASTQARHPLSYFQQFASTCADQCLFFLLEHKGRVVAAELVTHGTTVGYSFLGGTLAEGFPLAANDLLKHDIIAYLRRIGLRQFCLGGGLQPGDGIHRYKQKFSLHSDVEFMIASRIHNRSRFDSLVAAWSAAYPERLEHGMDKVLPYRF
jgi:hypothetical protein